MVTTDFLTPEAIDSFIVSALKEDIGSGDVSTLGSIPETLLAKAVLKIKANGLMAGMQLAQAIFRKVDPELVFSPTINDGDSFVYGDIGFEVSGKGRSILTAERLVLNCMQRMSGIATKTSNLSTLIKGQKAKLLDTRKTTPNFRMLEKWAVQIGGGVNHRFGLFDMVMLKDNHIDFAGGISNAVTKTKSYLKNEQLDLKIEVETRNISEVKEALDAGVDAIMLDNMMPSDMKEAVRLVNSSCLLEASGGITENTIQEIAECGVDYISVGALTHSFKSLDMSLKAVKI